MTPLASCRMSRSEDAFVAAIIGEIDSSNAASLEQQISDGVSNDALGLVIDLTEVRYLDSAGIRLLFSLNDRVRRRRQRLCIALPDDAMIRRVLVVAKVDAVIPIASTTDAAKAQMREAI